MKSRVVNQLAAAVLAATGELLLAAFAAAPQAQASTIYACYKKKGGTVHIIAKSGKCKKGETKLSWNSEGPAGKNGTNGTNGTNGINGTNGTNGTNGAVAGYATTQSGTANITSKSEVVLSKTLPAGHYLVSAKVETYAAATGAGGVETECELWDENISHEEVFLDSSQWIGALTDFVPTGYLGASTLPMQAALNTTKTSTVYVECGTPLNNATGGVVTAINGQLMAVQTNSNS